MSEQTPEHNGRCWCGKDGCAGICEPQTPEQEAREWYLANEPKFWEYDSASGVSYKDVPRLLVAYTASLRTKLADAEAGETANLRDAQGWQTRAEAAEQREKTLRDAAQEMVSCLSVQTGRTWNWNLIEKCEAKLREALRSLEPEGK